MNDLISRSALLKYFEEEKERIKVDSEKYHIHEEAVAGMEAALQAITNKVNEMPTAYDIDKVVEELEEKSDDIPIQYEDNYEKGFDDGIGYAIDIVKRGGN